MRVAWVKMLVVAIPPRLETIVAQSRSLVPPMVDLWVSKVASAFMLVVVLEILAMIASCKAASSCS
jgi:hypothetical protein